MSTDYYLLDPSSTLVTHILTKTGSKLSVGNPYLPSPPNTIGTNYAVNVQGATCSNNVSAFQIPADTSANRPAGQPGYIRYNTESYSVEYWNTQINSWVSLSSTITPVITSISPSYVPEDSSTNYIITGSNFNSSSSASFIGAVDGINYLPYGGATTLLSPTSLQTRNTLTMSDASINATGVDGAFYVKVVNSNTGLSTISSTPLLSFNTGPIWNTVANANLGTGLTGQLYTTSTTPFTALSASDIHPPIGYSFVVAPTTGTTVLLDASSALYAGKLYGQMPTTINNTITYPFTAQAQDSSGALSVVRTFNFTVAPTSYFLTPPPSGPTSNAFFTPNLYAPASTPFAVTYVSGATMTGFNFSLYFNTDISLNILLKGADGAGSLFGYGGGGGWAFGRFGFAKNITYTLLIGGGGAVLGPGAGPGTYVNGGGGLAGTQGYGAQGGGYTGLFTTSSTFGNALLVASGGGGGAYESYFYTANLSSGAGTVITTYTNGGSGGDTIGYDGLSCNVLTNPQGQNNTFGTPGNGGGGGGLGGTQSAGGLGGNTGYGSGDPGNPGGALFGGSPGASGNGGGGGAGGSGYYGGGSGSGTFNVGSSGGGGSSYVSNSVVSSGFSIGGVTTTALSTAGANGFANFYYSLNSTVTVTNVSGPGLPTPTTVNGSLCYVFNSTASPYIFTINQPVVMGYLCVAGGGGGGGNGGGGGGAGGLLQGTTFVTAGTSITIQVGAGGAGGVNPSGTSGTAGGNGSNSSISGGITSAITSIGGGGGGPNGPATANSGGSGGGGGSGDGFTPGTPGTCSFAGNIGTNPNIGTAGQGYAGGFGCHISGVLLGGGGGGGAGGPGSNLGPTPYDGTAAVPSSGGNGGKGIYSYITGSQVGYAGGGGGGMNTNATSGGSTYGYASGYGGCAGTAVINSNQFGGGNGGGGGLGGTGSGPSAYKPVSSGTNGTGGGGGGGEHPNAGTNGGAGGSGVVVIRIPQIW